MVNKKCEERISKHFSTYLKCVHQEGNVGIRELWRGYPTYSLKSIHRHATPIITSVSDVGVDHGKRRGRKRLLDSRDERSLIRSLRHHREQGIQVTSKRLQVESGLTHVSNRTIRRKLNDHGYKFLQARRKGLMSRKDHKRRLQFAKNVLKNYNNDTPWKEQLSFYLEAPTWL